MRSITVALLLVPFVLGHAPNLARAEPMPAEMVGLPPGAVVARLRSDGFAPLGRPVRGTGVFFVRALDPDDNDVRLTIDARTGRILEVRSMTVMAPAYHPPRYGAYPPTGRRPYAGAAGFEDATGALPVPPRPRPQAIAAMPATPASDAAPPQPAATGSPPAGTLEFPPVTPLE